jgi:hypothetical protein
MTIYVYNKHLPSQGIWCEKVQVIGILSKAILKEQLSPSLSHSMSIKLYVSFIHYVEKAPDMCQHWSGDWRLRGEQKYIY